MVRDLAKKLDSVALTQLASRLSSAMRLSSVAGGDIFGKIKGLIADMIEKLSEEAQADATEKAFCDKELAYTRGRKGEKENEISKLSTSIDQASARSAQLKEEVATLQKELSDLASSQASWTKFRGEEKTVYDREKAEMEEGLNGIKTALKILRDYYAQKQENAAEGAATGIIGLLEVCESDFSKGLAELISTEQSAVATFEAEIKDIEIERATKEQDSKYKTKEHVSLDKAVTEMSSDRAGVQTELNAINTYLGNLEGRCIAKAATYEAEVKRRTAEIAGLKDALEILEGEGVSFSLVQSKRSLRGVRHHA
jgi:chromosome segregation ATPase